jgi:hypothetical protein
LAKELPEKVKQQIKGAGLPTGGQVPFVPALTRNRRKETIVKKGPVLYGPKRGDVGYVDRNGRIWVKDAAHAGTPDHWDVQIDGGRDYVRVDFDGNQL